MIPIDAETVAVVNAEELAEAVSNNNGIIYVYLAENITLTTGIAIEPNKPSLTIDGQYPPLTGPIHSFTDMNSNNYWDTINVQSQSNINITFKNMTMNGRNYYGIPCIYETANTAGVTINYEKITYTGLQITHNPNGLTRYIDCNINITGAQNVQEVGEVNRVELGGLVRISHNSTSSAAFYFRGQIGNASFTILPEADVEITTTNYFMYNYTLFIANPVRYTIQSGAKFTLNSRIGISLSPSHYASSFIVENNATFRYIQATNNGNNPSLSLNGQFSAGQNSNVYMQAAYVTTNSLIRFSASGSLNITDPKSFVLYSGGAATLSFATTTPFYLFGRQLNYWAAATAFPTAGTVYDKPNYKWLKIGSSSIGDPDPLEIRGTASDGGTLLTGNNFTPQEIIDLPPLGNLQLQNARVLSIGNLPLSVNPIVNNLIPITGTTAPNAIVLITYVVDGTTYELHGTADGDGNFLVQQSQAIPTGTKVNVFVNLPFLITSLTPNVIEAGELTLQSAPVQIVFIMSPVSLSPLLLAREKPETAVRVYDSRVYSTKWNLTALTDGPFKTNSGRILPDAVVSVRDGTITHIGTNPVTVYVGEPNGGAPKTWDILWPDDEGILVRVTEPIYNNERYTAHLTWDVTAVEEP